jgi:hypothetical protein
VSPSSGVHGDIVRDAAASCPDRPGCKEDGTVAPIAGLSVEEFELRLRHGAPMIHGTRDMPELRSEAFNYSTFGTVRR